jgi:Domain of unknown function (DUF5655)
VTEVAEFFEGSPDGLRAYEEVRRALDELGDCEVRVTKSQVAFRRARGFAYLWIPERYLRRPAAPVVLSIALGRHDPSTRFKEVVHPSPAHWMHHLEIYDATEIDDEVRAWLTEAAQRAS